MISIFYITLSETKLFSNNNYIKEQQKHIEIIEKVLENYRELKHGYKNYLASISGYVLTENWEELKKYYSEICSTVEQFSNDELSNLIKIKNYSVFGLFVEKIHYAKQSGICVFVNIPNEIFFIWNPVKTLDFCYILGNLLDNSIEASKNQTPSIIKILCLVDTDEMIIEIKNTYCENLKNEGFDRGHGLEIVYKKINKYKDLTLSNFIKNEFYIQQLVVDLGIIK